MPPLPGGELLLAGRYAYDADLTRGSSGRVMRVRDTHTGERWAAKAVAAPRAAGLAAELDALREVRHTGVVRPRELLRVDGALAAPWALASGTAVLVEELVSGSSLATARFDSWEQLAQAGAQLASALAALHRMNVVHGDVSPHNVVAAEGRWVLVDLGHAGGPRPGGAGASGTPGFMPPEAFVGARSAGADLFALGATLLAGAPSAPPLTEPLDLADAYQRAQRLQALAQDRLRDAPPHLAEVIVALLAPSPELRPDDAREVAARFGWGPNDAGAADAALSAPLVGHARSSGKRLSSALRAARFVGHEDAMSSALDALLERSVGALPATLVCVSGPPGCGRDRFVQELAQRLQRAAFDAGFPVPTVSTRHSLPPPPAHPNVIAWHAPPAAARRSASGSPPDSASRGRRASDEASLGTSPDLSAALRFLDATLVLRAPSVVLASVSAKEGDALQRAHATDPRVLHLRLAPVDSAAIARLLQDVFGEPPAAGDVDAARALTGGLVGRLVEVLATRALEGELTRATDLPGLRAPASTWSPPPLPTATLELLEQASVCEHGLPLQDVTHEGLSAALTLGLLTLDQRGQVLTRGDVRDALLRDMTASRRARVARGLLHRVDEPLVRAHLAIQAGEAELAESELRRGLTAAAAEAGDAPVPARVAALLGELPAAHPDTVWQVADWLRRAAATELALVVLGDRGELELLALRAEVHRQQGDSVQAARVLEQASRTPSALMSEHYLRVAGRLAVGDGQAQALLERVRASHPELLRTSPAVLEVQALDAWSRGELDLADAHAEQAAATSMRRELPGEAARGASLRASIAQRRGDTAGAYTHGRRAFELAEVAGERLAAAVYGLNLGLACFELGRLGEALTRVSAGAERLAEIGRDALLAQAVLNLAHVHVAFGDDRAAARLLPLARQKAAQVERADLLSHVDLTWAGLELRRGKRVTSVAHVDAALANLQSCDPSSRALVQARAALALAEAAQHERARACLTSAPSDDEQNADVELTRRLARGTLALHTSGPARRDAIEQLAATATDPRSWERQLQATLLLSELLDREGDAAGAFTESRRARALLDAALDSLPNTARPHLLSAVRYQAALRVPPLPDPATARYPGARDVFRELPLYMRRFVSAADPAQLLQRVADAAQALARAERGFVVERSPEGEWTTLASTDASADTKAGRTLGFSRSVAGRALATGRSVSTMDAIDDAQLTRSGSVLGIGTRSVLATPLHCGGRQLVLYVDDRTRPAAFDHETDEVFSACAQLAGLALAASWDAAALRLEREKLAEAEANLRSYVDTQRDEITALRRVVMPTERGGMVAGPGPMRRTLELAERAATSAVPVLILGESGTGKELVARFIHDQSERREKRFVGENCAAIPDTLLESTLFGHERGAFTGADRARQGLFHAADGGTLFLDEIGEMSASMQSKLLRVLQNGEVRSLGGSRTATVDVRLVTATHRDLGAMVAAGQFREDLYYRITVVSLTLPALRERRDDIPLLVRHFLRKHHPGPLPRVTQDAMQRLVQAPWPGNVRQLENEVQRLLVMAGDPIEAHDLSLASQRAAGDTSPEPSLAGALGLREHVDALERRLITAALQRTQNNQTQAARELGVSRYGLQKMMKRLGLRD